MKPESMAATIQRRLALVGIVSVVLTALGAVFLFYRAFANQVDTGLLRTAQAVAAGYDAALSPQGGAAADAAGVQVLRDCALAAARRGDTLRLTLVAPDGAVLYDSTGRTDLPNHAARPEIAAALAGGTGFATRRSATLGYETHYCALRLSDGRVVRLADDTADIWSAYNRVLPLLVLPRPRARA